MVQKVAPVTVKLSRVSQREVIHGNGCCTGYEKGRFGVRGNGYKMFFLSLSVPSENWVPFYCENYRDNNQII